MTAKSRLCCSLALVGALGCAPVVSASTPAEPERQLQANFSFDPELDREILIVVEPPPVKPLESEHYIPVCRRPGHECFIHYDHTPIYFRTTVGNSLRDAIEQSVY